MPFEQNGHRRPVPPVPSILAHGLEKSYGSLRALNNVSLAINPGEIVGLVGANGAGKSTLLRALSGAEQVSGSVTILGHDIRTLVSLAGIVGCHLGGASAHPSRTVRAHLEMMAALTGSGRRERMRLLRTVDLADAKDRRVGGLSLGMKQRLMLACAMLGDPAILLLDEPFNGLDPIGVAWLSGHLLGFARSGGSVVIASHHLRELEGIIDRLIVLDRGSKTYDNNAKHFIGRYGTSQVVARCRCPEKLVDVLERSGVGNNSTEYVGGLVVVAGATAEAVAEAAFSAGIVLVELRYEYSGLQHAFVESSRGVRRSEA